MVWELRDNQAVLWDDERNVPVAALTPVKPFRLDAGRKAGRMREERLERSGDDDVWSKAVKVAENPVPECAGLETATCGVCEEIHTVTRGKRTKMWLEGHIGECKACRETTMCSTHTCRPVPTPTKASAASLEKRARPTSATPVRRRHDLLPTSVLTPSLLCTVHPIIPTHVGLAEFDAHAVSASNAKSMGKP